MDQAMSLEEEIRTYESPQAYERIFGRLVIQLVKEPDRSLFRTPIQTVDGNILLIESGSFRTEWGGVQIFDGEQEIYWGRSQIIMIRVDGRIRWINEFDPDTYSG